MLNYIWAGLIAISLLFALTSDVSDVARDRYRNGFALPVRVELPEGQVDGSRPETPVVVMIDPATYQRIYRVSDEAPADRYDATALYSAKGFEIRFAPDAALPPTLATIRDMTGGDAKQLRARLEWVYGDPTQAASRPITTSARLTFEPVRFVKLQAITTAAIDMAKSAVTIALGLIGVLALWLGLMRIGEKAGLIDIVVRATQPVLRPLFPDIPPGHPAMGMIAVNLAANMLGLGNAATAPGLKAMEELQKLNPKKDTATNAMVMLLALNTAGVQLVPQPVLIAVLGISAVDLLFPIWLVTGCCAVIAVLAAKGLERLPGYRRSDPQRDGSPAPEPAEVA